MVALAACGAAFTSKILIMNCSSDTAQDAAPQAKQTGTRLSGKGGSLTGSRWCAACTRSSPGSSMPELSTGDDVARA
eukprot:3320552-Rhodomonas_salina.5